MYRVFSDTPVTRAEAPKPSVCIVTGELVGPFKNGGIGTSMTGLAECLARAGFPVTVLYTGAMYLPEAEMRGWRDRYRRIGIELAWLHLENLSHLAGPLRDYGFSTAYLAYEYLRARRFDVIQFNDCLGDGFQSLAMKRLGVAFQDSLLCVALHSPSQWVFELNRTLPDNLLCSAFNYAERLSTRCADLLWSPSRYLLDWVQAKGFALPPATFVQQYAIPTLGMFDETAAPTAARGPSDSSTMRPTEIVFFGRLEERKGLRLFCNVLTGLNDRLAEQGIAVTLLGKPGSVGDRDAMDYLHQQSAGWRFAWRTEVDLGQQEAIDYIRSRPALAVMPSPADNSPCTIYEALTFGLPFIAARTGGIPELICEEDRDAVLFDNAFGSLTAKLEQILREGVPRARPAFSQETTRQHWIGAFARWRDFLPTPAPLEAVRRLKVVIDCAEGAELDATLESLADAPMVERIVVLHRGTFQPTAEAQGLATIRAIDLATDNAADLREELGEDAGEAVLWLRAGVRVLADALPGALRALQCAEVDGLVPAARIGTEGHGQISPPLGGSASFSFYEGATPNGGLFTKSERHGRICREAPLAIEAEFFGLVDQAIAADLQLWPYAEPVLQQPVGYRVDLRRRGAPERIAAYGAVTPTERFYIAAMGFGAVRQEARPTDFQRSLRHRLSKMRLGWAVRLALRVVPLPLAKAAMQRLSAALA